MEGKDDRGPATAQLTFPQVDIQFQPINKLEGLVGKDVNGSVELEAFRKISYYWPANDRPAPKHIHIIVELPLGNRCVYRVIEISLTLSRLTPSAANSIYPLSALLRHWYIGLSLVDFIDVVPISYFIPQSLLSLPP